MVVTIMPDHLCYILLEGSSDLRLERLQESLRVSFRFIKETECFMLHDDDVAPAVSIDAQP